MLWLVRCLGVSYGLPALALVVFGEHGSFGTWAFFLALLFGSLFGAHPRRGADRAI